MRHSNAIWLMVALASAAPAMGQSLVERETYRPIVADHRAYRPGDKLTVWVTEAASAKTTARTATDKQGSVGASANLDDDSFDANARINEDFNGGGRIERTNKLLAQITVVVQSIDANGDLLVRGQQEIVVNEERQWLAVEGRVRPQDIRADNTILSTRLADAKLQYTGKGLLAEKQKPGILTRFLSWLGLL